MGPFISNSCPSHQDSCECLCNELKKFKCQNVTIITKSGQTIQGKLKKVIDCCLVKILEQVPVSPFWEEQATFVRCTDIESFSVQLFEDDCDKPSPCHSC